jgi:hypothetical protein
MKPKARKQYSKDEPEDDLKYEGQERIIDKKGSGASIQYHLFKPALCSDDEDEKKWRSRRTLMPKYKK